MEYRPATRDDILEFLPSVPFSARAEAAVDGGVVVGIGGIYYDRGRVFAFSHARAEMSARDRIKGARRILDIMRKVDGAVWAIKGDLDTAERTLEHFNFEKVTDLYYLWRGDK